MSHDRGSSAAWWVVAVGVLLGITSLVLTVFLVGPQIEGLLAPAAWTVLIVGLSLQTMQALRTGRSSRPRLIFLLVEYALVGGALLLGVQQASQIALGWRAAIQLILIATILVVHGYQITHPLIADSLEKGQRRFVARWPRASLLIIFGGVILGPLASRAVTHLGDLNPHGWVGEAVPFFTLFWALWPLLKTKQPEVCLQAKLWKFLLISAIGSVIPAVAVALSTIYELTVVPSVAGVAFGSVVGALLNRQLLSRFDGWIKR